MRHRIHVPLRNRPSELRSTDAAAAGEGRFRILGEPIKGEKWRFKRGEVVECVSQPLSDGILALVAVHSCSKDPEYRKRRMTYAVLGGLFGAFVGAGIALLLKLSLPIVMVATLLGGVVVGVLSVRWRDAAWRGWDWLEATWWW